MPIRYVKTLRTVYSSSTSEADRTELDSHADTCIAGSNSMLLSEDGRQVTVSGFSSATPHHDNVPIATAATVWANDSGVRYLLVLHESLFFGDRIPGTLLNPNQLGANHVVVDECPRQFSDTSSHSLSAFTENGDRVTIPLTLRGIMSGFESVKPTLEDLDNLERIHLTADMPWRPMSTHFEDEEDAAQRRSAKTATTRSGNPVDNDHRVIAAVRSFGGIGHCPSIADNAFPLDPCPDNLGTRLVALVQVHYNNAEHDTEDWCPQPGDKRPSNGDVTPRV